MGVRFSGRSQTMRRKLHIERLEDRRVMAADFNGDETVDDLDLNRWKFGFGTPSGATAAYGDTDGDADVDGADFLQWQRDLGPKQNNLIPYRPQSVQDENNPIASSIYDPFPKTPVHSVDEAHSVLGPGIRVNYDDDDNNGIKDALEVVANIPLENDLIEVKIERAPGTGDLVLVHGPKLRVYYDHAKADPVAFPSGTSEVLPFNNDTLTIFVEWISTTHGTDNLSLVEPATATTHDTVRFHSFRSFSVVFGGRGQDPHDTDGDGNIGDPRGAGGNREGIFDLAQTLYNAGRDVMAFDEADYTVLAESVAEREIKNAIDNRYVKIDFMGGVAVMGYSQGGGVVQNIIEDELDPRTNFDYLPVLGVYLDAVVHDFGTAETDWPDQVFRLLNIYQTLALGNLGGGDINDNEPEVWAILEEINVTTDAGWDATLNHSLIDDDLQVLNHILLTHSQLLLP